MSQHSRRVWSINLGSSFLLDYALCPGVIKSMPFIKTVCWQRSLEQSMSRGDPSRLHRKGFPHVAQKLLTLPCFLLPLQLEVRSRIQKVRGDDWAALWGLPGFADGSAAYFVWKNINLTIPPRTILGKRTATHYGIRARNLRCYHFTTKRTNTNKLTTHHRFAPLQKSGVYWSNQAPSRSILD